MGYVIFLVVATILGGGIPGFLIGIGLIAFWAWTESMGTPKTQSDEHSSKHQSFHQSLSLIQRLEPCIDILCSYALKYEKQWTSPKVQFVKDSFIHLCETEEDQTYLRDRLKYDNRPSVATSRHLWLTDQNPNQNDREVIYIKVCILLVNTSSDTEQILKDCLSFGTSIGLAFEYCDQEIRKLIRESANDFEENTRNHADETENNEVKKAADILGVTLSASREEIQKAYRNKIKEFHPDRNVNVTETVKKMLEEQAHLINNARDILLKYIS